MLVDLILNVLGSSYFQGFLVFVLIGLVYQSTSGPKLYHGVPTVGIDTGKGIAGLEKARQDWYVHGKEILDRGMKQCVGCFQVFTDVGPKIVLPNRYADEIRNHPDLHFGKAIQEEFFGSYPGFSPFAHNTTSQVVVDTVRGRLTQSLGLITEELADETSKTVDELFGQPETWTEITYKPILLKLIARVSTRVFIGPELCENEDWLRISKEYAVESFIAVRALRKWHFSLRPIVHWFLPECRKLRATLAEARRIIMPVIEKRRESNRQAREAGQPPSKTADTIGWMDEAAKGKPYDVADAQIGLSLAAIHTTTEMVSGLISDLCANPEYFEPMRAEIASVLADKGWSKKALHDLKLMDSAMKESQRHHRGDVASMHRMAEKPITLSDGTQIPQNAFTMVGIDKMYSTSQFKNPHDFDGSRFLNMRQQAGQENRWQFVTTSPEHLSFGHGKHACPGRFFAGNEIKVVLAHLLMKYDWKFTSEGRKQDVKFGQQSDTDPSAKALIKKRELDVVL
ncbi:hypothetical protein AWENTII_008836 [Aspergillus wentii]